MNEIDRIADQLQRVYDGDAWHGPSVKAALAGVDAQMASGRPLAGGHTICELVLHMTAWTREVARRLRIGAAQEPEEGDWPSGRADDDAQWQAVITALDDAQATLVGVVQTSDEARLHDNIGDVRTPALGSGVTRYVTLHGLVQHHAYHAGQISLLKKAQRP